MESLDALRESTGEANPHDALLALQRLPPSALDSLAERVLAHPPEGDAEVGDFELWPVLNARMSTFATGGGSTWFTATAGPAGINLMAAIDPRDTGSGRFPNAVLRALLYCHGLVLEDPLALASDLVAGTSLETRHLAHRAMNAAAASLAEIAPLLDAGVVRTFFVPPSARGHDLPTGGAAARVREQPILASQDEIWDAFEASFVSGLGPHLAELWARIRAGDKSPPLELVERAASEGDPTVVEVFVQVLSELRPAAVVDNAIGIVAESLGDLHRLGGRYDLLCPTPLFARLALTGDPLQEMRLHELAHLQVPGLDQLLVEDVVSMRTHSDAFALWRARLSTGLERARGLRLEFGPEVDVLTPVAEVLQDARAALFQEVERSRTLSAHARSALGFVSGAIGGAVGNATSGSAGAAVGAAGGVLAFVLERILAAGDPLPGFLRRHYVVFDR